MKKIKMLTKISLKYWLHHKRRLLTLMLSLVFGVSALCCTALLVRSEKDAVLEEELRILGNYDGVLYGADDDTAEKLKDDKDIIGLGIQYELGYVQNDSGAKFYAAAFKDKESEDIYHMTCTRGRYPEKENEVAMDLYVAKGLGIKPYPNEKVTLKLYNAEDKKLTEKEYTVCGIFEKKHDDSHGGWYRYTPNFQEDEYNMPGVYFDISQNDIFKSKSVVCFIQTDIDYPNDIYFRARSLTDDELVFTEVNGRRFSYSYIMGLGQQIYDKYDGNTYTNLDKAIKNEDTLKDFYSQILMPLLTAIIFIIVILSVVGLTKNIIKDKQENFAVLRSLGLEQWHLKLYIFCDFTLTALVCIAIGLGLGSLAHIGLVDVLNKMYDLKLHYGFDCVKYVNAVTFDPYVLSFVTTLICVELSVFIALFSFRGKTPVQMFAQSKTRKRLFRRNKSAGRYRSWKWLLIRRIKLRNVRIAIVSILVMSVALTGYTYFDALARKENFDLTAEKENSGFEYWDYKAEKSSENDTYVFGIENHHEKGLQISSYEDLENKDYVKDIFGRYVCRSTRLSFDKSKLDEQTQYSLKPYELRKFSDIDATSALEFDKAQKESEEAMIEKIGYNKNDLICSCPTIGLFDNSFGELEKFVVDGRIDKQKLHDGTEILLVMDMTAQAKFEKAFKAGDSLPLSDIVLNEKEEQIDFTNIDPEELGEPVYDKIVKKYDGTEIEERSYAIGKRKDINVKIGAILVLDIDAAQKYMTNAAEGDNGLNLFCYAKAFETWKIGKRNLTEVSIKLTSDSEINKADEYWYSIMSDTKGMSSRSSAEITTMINNGTHKTMSIYYSMMIIVLLTSAVTVAITLYTDIRMRSSKFAMLRACGMSTRQILFMICRQNLLYPIVGVLCSFVPLMLCNKLFKYIAQKVESGEWSPRLPIFAQGAESVPWINNVPYEYNLYDSNIKAAVIIMLAVYFVIILLVTLPQIRFIRKQSIVDEIEKSSF